LSKKLLIFVQFFFENVFESHNIDCSIIFDQLLKNSAPVFPPLYLAQTDPLVMKSATQKQGCQMVYFFKPKIPIWVHFGVP
jgi:hypothetical protein